MLLERFEELESLLGTNLVKAEVALRDIGCRPVKSDEAEAIRDVTPVLGVLLLVVFVLVLV